MDAFRRCFVRFTSLLAATLLLVLASPPPGGAADDPGAVFTAGPDMTGARMNHHQTLLPDGRVVAFGGHGPAFVPLATADAWHPGTSTFTSLAMNYVRDGSAFARLADGRYLLAAGFSDPGFSGPSSLAEIYDPADDSFTPASGYLQYGRAFCTAVTLTGGKVLIVGNWGNSAWYGEVFDPATGDFSRTAGQLSTERSLLVAVPTADGGALVLGGCARDGGPYQERVEVYNPLTDTFATLRETLLPAESG
jgi:hypothetical protein